jgi:hypothetical protein
MIHKIKVTEPSRADYINELREILKPIAFVGDSGVVKKAKIEELLVKLS